MGRDDYVTGTVSRQSDGCEETLIKNPEAGTLDLGAKHAKQRINEEYKCFRSKLEYSRLNGLSLSLNLSFASTRQSHPSKSFLKFLSNFCNYFISPRKWYTTYLWTQNESDTKNMSGS